MARSTVKRHFPGSAVLGLALLSGAMLPAQRVETRLVASDGAPADMFGTAVAVRGNLLVAGAFQDDGLIGSAYVFERSGAVWTQRAKLIASERRSADEFGFAVAIGDPDTVFVSARRNDAFGTDSGAVYVFERTSAGWAQSARLVAADPAPGAIFGAALAAEGQMLAVGAWGMSNLAGAAYVFERGAAGWAQVAKLTAGGGLPNDTFGAGIGCRGGRIVVGAPGEDALAANSGAAYVFERGTSGWVQAARLKPADLGIDDGFGLNVDLDGDLAVVGARLHQRRGAAYVFERGAGGWLQAAKLAGADTVVGDLFGHDVAIHGERVLAGARNAARQAGAAYVFTRNAGVWNQTEKLSAGDAAAGDMFGQSVGLDGRLVAIGAWGDDAQRGSVYLLEAPSAVDPTLSLLSVAPAVVPAYGGALATVVVDPRDARGARIQGPLPVRLATSAGTLLGSATAVGDGTWTQQLAPSPSAAAATISAIVDGIPLAATGTVRFLAVDLTTSTLEVAPDTIEVGFQAMVTLTVRDDRGVAVGRGGLPIAFATSAGALLGVVQDLGDGRYTQQITGRAAATAAITATVEGLDFADSALLTIQDAKIPPGIVGMRADGSLVPYKSIQAAVKAVRRDGLRRILVPPGRYDEIVRVSHCRGLVIEGLARYGRVAVRGFAIVASADITLTGFEVDATGTHLPGVAVLMSRGVVLQHLFVHHSAKSGFRIGACSRDVVLSECRAEACGRHGVRIETAQAVELRRCELVGNGLCGVLLGSRVKALIADTTLRGNGTAGDDRRGYGVLRERCGGRVDPREVTLRRNLLQGNRGRVVPGRSTTELGNYDLMLDGSDEQAPL